MTQRLRQVRLWGTEKLKVVDLELLSPVLPEDPPVVTNQLSFDLLIDLTSDEAGGEDRRLPGVRRRLQTAPRWQLAVKRAIDIVGATMILILVSPVMLLTALAIVVTSRGPVLYGQDRVGYMGQRFRFLKFRSMCHDAEARKNEILDRNHHVSGPIFKVRDDPRMTPVGKIIRRLSIDELPQFLHVIQGTMSLVGPRPLPFEDVVAQIPEDHLNDQSMYTTWDLQRLTTKPGLTCIWQVSGRSELDYDTWLKMDIEYIENWSLWLDLKLLAQTVPAVLSGRGAY
ncbi:MAG TPA: sugar transferase [Acidimicrobiia bacterium]|nr:sugar transferase [Acidimicrobiia bacterium]